MAALEAGRRGDSHYRLDYAPVGGRLIGRNELPRRAIVSTYPQAWALLGVNAEVHRYDEILALAGSVPTVRDWTAAHPLKAITLYPEWSGLLAAYRWLDDHRGSGRYLREIGAPGVDTKFVERHRSTLAGLLGVPASSAAFLTSLGLAPKPELLRLRADPALGAFSSLTDVTARPDELRAIQIAVRMAVIVENEVTFLSLPVPSGRWGLERTPAHARLDRLSVEELRLYDDLVSDRLGDRVRLEQERIDWGWAEQHFPFA